MVAAKVADLVFHAAFLVSFARRAEGSLELPVRAKGDETFGLFSLSSPQNLFDRARQIVIAQAPKDAAIVMKRTLMPIEKGLLRRVQIGPMESRAARHTAQVEDLHRQSFSIDLGDGLIPIDLSLDAELINLRHENLTPIGCVAQLPILNVLAHPALGDVTSLDFLTQANEDPMPGMALFTRAF